MNKNEISYDLDKDVSIKDLINTLLDLNSRGKVHLRHNDKQLIISKPSARSVSKVSSDILDDINTSIHALLEDYKERVNDLAPEEWEVLRSKDAMKYVTEVGKPSMELIRVLAKLSFGKATVDFLWGRLGYKNDPERLHIGGRERYRNRNGFILDRWNFL